MSDINTIDGDLLYQVIDSNTKTIAPEFYKNFEVLGEDTINAFIELKNVLTSNVNNYENNVINYFKQLDEKLPTFPSPIQNWFKQFYKNRIPIQIRMKIGFLKSLDKLGYNSKLHLVDPAQWYNNNTTLPIDTLNQKIPTNMSNISKNVPSIAAANFASRQKRLNFCKERCRSVAIKKITTPNKSHGDVGMPVGDYEHPKRMAKASTDYFSRIIEILGVNAKYFFESLNFNSHFNNLQKGLPNIEITEKFDDKEVKTTLFGNSIKKLESSNPFTLPKI